MTSTKIDWEGGVQKYLLARGFGMERQMCNKGQTLTGTRFEGKDYAPPVGNRPSWMCLDENLNADWARAELHLCAVTSDLDDDDERKASLATPAAAARTMHRAWEMAPTGPRIVEDILRYRGTR